MKNKIIYINSILLILLLLFTGCKKTNDYSKNPEIINSIYFNTIISIKFYDKTPKNVKQKIENLCKYYDTLLNKYNKKSDIYKINNSPNKEVQIKKETFEILQYADKYYLNTDKNFNYKINPLVSLWGINTDNPKVPEQHLIENAIKKINNANFKIYKKNINNKSKYYALSSEKNLIDLGGIAKGFIADKIKIILDKEKIAHVLINLGGNILALNGKANGDKFNNAIKSPFKEDEPILSLKCNNISIVSSGQYERNFTENQKVYGHILDLKTGYPVDNDLEQVTIFSKNSTLADAYSTACFVMGLENSLDFINKQKNVHAIFIDKNKQIYYSKNFPYKVKEYK